MKLGTSKKTLLKIFIITIIAVGFFGIVGINIINAQEDNLAETIRNSVNPPGEIENRLLTPKNSNKEFVPLGGIPGVIDKEAAKDPSKFFNGMFTFGISIAGFLAVLMIAVGGIQYMSTDAISGKTEGKERIQYAIMGLLLVLFSWVLLNQINPNILNLDIFSDISGGSSRGGNSGGSNTRTTSNRVSGNKTNNTFIEYSDKDIYVGADERGFYKVIGEDKNGNEIRVYPDLQIDPNPESTKRQSSGDVDISANFTPTTIDDRKLPVDELIKKRDSLINEFTIKQLEEIIKSGNVSESDKELARQKILELKNQ